MDMGCIFIFCIERFRLLRIVTIFARAMTHGPAMRLPGHVPPGVLMIFVPMHGAVVMMCVASAIIDNMT